MAYRLKRKEPLLEGIRRIAHEQIGVMVGELVETPDLHEAVHLFRKRCKRMRAMLRWCGLFSEKPLRTRMPGIERRHEVLLPAAMPRPCWKR